MTTINGLPAHALLVHAVVVLLPLAALAVVLHAVWPAAARRLSVVTPLLCLAVVVLVPITTNAGEHLEESLGGSNPLIDRHAELADQILPWTIALAVVGLGQWVIGRWSPLGLVVRIPAGVVSIGIAVVATVVLVRAADAGAQAVWGGVG
ncbi:DUF2231 domain-containing protein [Nocardioides sp. CER19]|uniref:DUF2231 domain-containing protein n=1 Tax=Nocardioides sp. CER19 TaxID=3038538 RepID=UPI0024485323|nr:DUF2231 domain-containing protein [Nocardioides sp. CER19]MDH2413372.1 hypothetical protein [Nocardioides sp. CER19]